MAIAGGKEGQLAVVGEEEEVRERLYFCICRQWGGWGDLTVIEQGFRGIVLGKGLHKCISNRQAAGVGTSSFCFVVFSFVMEP